MISNKSTIVTILVLMSIAVLGFCVGFYRRPAVVSVYDNLTALATGDALVVSPGYQELVADSRVEFESFKFVLSNRSNSPIKILGIASSCPCMQITTSLVELEAKQQAEIEVKVSVQDAGYGEYKIYIFSDAALLPKLVHSVFFKKVTA